MKRPEYEGARWLAQARDDLAFARWLLSEDRFYIPTRYPNGLPGGTPFESFTRADLEQALAMAERIVGAAGRLLP
jgi:HEPN domain-containing protein